MRTFLSARQKVNKGIRKTLASDPAAFFALNNGLSATAAHATVKDVGGRKCLTHVVGLQIVNGAQTTGSIQSAAAGGLVDLSRVFVPMKLTCVADSAREDLIPAISRYSNSQTLIRGSDLSSNRPFLRQLERLSRAIYAPPSREFLWFFERARGQYAEELAKLNTAAQKKAFKAKYPTRCRFSKLDAAKFVLAWEQQPHIVGLGSQKCFANLADNWPKAEPATPDGPSEADWIPDEDWYSTLIAKAIVFRTVKTLVTRSGIPAYRANVVAYMVALIARHVDDSFLSSVWQTQALDPAVEDVLKTWCKPIRDALVETSGHRNVTEWCKKSDCWEAIENIELDRLPTPQPAVRQTTPATRLDLSDESFGDRQLMASNI